MRAQVANRRLHVAGEGPDLVAHDRRGLAQEGLRSAQRRLELTREGPQALQRRAELVGQPVDLGQRGLGLGERRRELAQGLAQRRLLGGEGLEVGVGRVDQRGQLVVAPRERGRELLEVVDHAPDVAPPLGQQAGEARPVAGGGLEALERLAQVLLGGLVVALRRPGGLVVEGEGALVEQDAHVGARVAVELGQHLVGVHVGQRVGLRHAPALGQVARLLGAGIEREEHVLQAGLRPQQDGGVAVDRPVLVPDLHGHHGPAVLERDRSPPRPP